MGIFNPTVEHYKDFFNRFENGLLDYFFEASLIGDDGKDYFVTVSLFRESLGKKAVLHKGKHLNGRVSISMEPIWFLTTPSSKIIEKGERPDFEIRAQMDPMIKPEVVSSCFTLKADKWEFMLSPPSYRVIYHGEDVFLDLAFKSLGIPFWFNEGKEEGAQKTPSTVLWGSEVFCDVEGLMKINGKELHVKGNGIFEHVIAEQIAFMESGWQAWIWFVFEEMYGLVYHVHGSGYKDGAIYLRKEKEYLTLRSLDIDNAQWAYSPVLQHHWPVSIIARGVTDKGNISIKGDVIRSQTWGQIDKYRPAVTIPGSDMEARYTGVFTYNDGRTIDLRNGKGGYEAIGIFNFAN
jgi:hypothetical protein